MLQRCLSNTAAHAVTLASGFRSLPTSRVKLKHRFASKACCSTQSCEKMSPNPFRSPQVTARVNICRHMPRWTERQRVCFLTRLTRRKPLGANRCAFQHMGHNGSKAGQAFTGVVLVVHRHLILQPNQALGYEISFVVLLHWQFWSQVICRGAWHVRNAYMHTMTAALNCA